MKHMKGIISGLIVLSLMVTSIILLSGCTGNHGWRVNFGVSPVSEINDNASLKHKELVND